jgi:tetratricopeptide (TPR) repeat protein
MTDGDGITISGNTQQGGDHSTNIQQNVGQAEKVVGQEIHHHHQKTRTCPPPPAFPAKFGGREKRLREIMDKIKAGTDTAITAVHGMGGIGKTTLAQALAAQMHTDKIFRAVLWADVTRTPDPITILGGWVVSYADASFDVSAFQGDEAQIAQAVKSHLESVINEKCDLCEPPRVLVVLDDVWDSGREAARLIKRACPDHATILITTRSENVAVDLGAAAESLAYLTPDEAAAMLRTYLPAAPEDALRRLGKALGGHALALELAARRIHKEKRPGESEAQRVERLLSAYEQGIPSASPFADLKLEQGEKKEDNLTRSLFLSYETLSPDDQRRFRALGVLAYDAPFDAELLAALWELPLEEVYTCANDLRLLSLLDMDDSGYRQHGLLRAYARALLEKEDETAAAFNRYADHTIQIAAQFKTLPPEDWAQLDPHLPHIHAVGDELVKRFNHAVGEPEFGRGLARQTQGKARLAPTATDDDDDPATALTHRTENFANNITRYLANRREVRRLEWLEMGLAASRQTGNQGRESLFLNELALAWSALGEKRKALEFYEQALPLSRAVGDRGGEATTLNNIGGVWSALGEKRQALDYYEQALPILRAVGARSVEATTLNNIGTAWADLGEQRKALDYYEQALSIIREIGDKRNEAGALNNIGTAWNALGEKRKALDYLEQALPLRRAVGDRGGEATTLNNIGSAWDDLGEKRKALDFYEQALPVFRAVGDRGGEAATLNNIGLAWSALGEKRKALDYLEQALPVFRAVGDRGGEATTLNNIGKVWDDLGDKRKALDYLEQALPVFRAVGDRGGEAATLNNIGMAWSALGDKRKALDFYEQALPVFQAVGDRGGEATTLNYVGLLLAETLDFVRALPMLQQAVTLSPDNSLYLYWLALVQLALGQYEISIENQHAATDDDPLSQVYEAIWCHIAYQLLSQFVQAETNRKTIESLLPIVQPPDQQNRVRALWILYQGNASAARTLYEAVLSIHKQTRNSIFSPRFYLQILVHLFPQRQDIVEMYEWFKAETERIAAKFRGEESS